MPLLITIGIIWIIYKSAKKPRKRKAPPPLPVYDPVKIQIAQSREIDRQRREQDRQADRQRRIAEQDRKRREQEQKQLAQATANANKAKQYLLLARQYNDYIAHLNLPASRQQMKFADHHLLQQQ